MKLQQYTAPVQAKGVEDTAFYRYNVLVSMNEVGGDPARSGVSPAEFHEANRRRRERFAGELTATSTHDTKLGEDVRARLSVLAELSEEWSREVGRWRRINRAHRSIVDGEPAPDRNDEYRFYQVLVGVCPFGASTSGMPSRMITDDLVDRLRAYMNKSIKEAKTHTSWINENRAYDDAVSAFVERSLGDGARFVCDGASLHRTGRARRRGELTGAARYSSSHRPECRTSIRGPSSGISISSIRTTGGRSTRDRSELGP